MTWYEWDEGVWQDRMGGGLIRCAGVEWMRDFEWGPFAAGWVSPELPFYPSWARVQFCLRLLLRCCLGGLRVGDHASGKRAWNSATLSGASVRYSAGSHESSLAS